MAAGLLGRKVGMTQIFGESGELIPVTVIEAGPCHVLQIRSADRDGYEAMQLGFLDKPRRLVGRSERGHVAKLDSKRGKRLSSGGVELPAKAGCEPQRFIREMPGLTARMPFSVKVELTTAMQAAAPAAAAKLLKEAIKQALPDVIGVAVSDAAAAEVDATVDSLTKAIGTGNPTLGDYVRGVGASGGPPAGFRFESGSGDQVSLVVDLLIEMPVKVGDKLAVSVFKGVKAVDVIGITRGRGTSGVMRRWNFQGQRATHGVKKVHRHGGSTGNNTWPARVWKGKKMAGRYGNERSTMRNIRVVRVDLENNLLLVWGAVPGFKGAYVMIQGTNMVR